MSFNEGGAMFELAMLFLLVVVVLVLVALAIGFIFGIAIPLYRWLYKRWDKWLKKRGY